MLRRMNMMALCVVLLFLSVRPVRELAFRSADRPEVRQTLTTATGYGQAGTLALMSYVQMVAGNARTTINGQPAGGTVDSSANFRLDHGQTFGSTDEIEAILKAYKSPAAGSAEALLLAARAQNIDAAYPLAQFIVESRMATDPAYAWAGRHNPGNIMTAVHEPVSYSSWAEGWRAHVNLLADYRDGNGFKRHDTIRAALNTWAPPEDNNDTNGYADFVEKQVAEWRRVRAGRFVADGSSGQVTLSRPLQPIPVGQKVQSGPLALTGGLGTNVVSALSHSYGLNDITVAPGKDWSFNENWVLADDLVTYANVYGGGICDMAGRYSEAWHKLGLQTEYTYHGFQLNGLSAEDSTAIWSSGVRGGQDLVLKNTSDRTAHLRAVMQDNTLTVIGWLD